MSIRRTERKLSDSPSMPRAAARSAPELPAFTLTEGPPRSLMSLVVRRPPAPACHRFVTRNIVVPVEHMRDDAELAV